MKICKKALTVLLAFSMLISFCFVFSSAVDGKAMHISNTDNIYGGDNYLFDTLTLAGSGFDENMTYTVAALENLALDESLNLAYLDTYSMLTSGGVYSSPSFEGLKLYDLLVYSGLDTTLPDSTAVKCISKDGYAIPFTLGMLRSDSFNYYTSKYDSAPERTGLPAIIAYASNGVPLIGPTGTQPVYQKFTEADGFVETADNIGGPLRLVVGQTAASEFNAPNCSKWIAAIVVGDPEGYTYQRPINDPDASLEPEQGGDWTHGDMYPDFKLTIRGSEAKFAKLSLKELEAMEDIVIREYYAASAGKAAYEGFDLCALICKYLKAGVDFPTKVTLISTDGYTKSIDLNDLEKGIVSQYQPGKTKNILLAYAINGSPLVPGKDDENYNGFNAYGPLRLVVENTISYWVKNVQTIIIGDDTGFSDLDGYVWAEEAINNLSAQNIVNGTGNGCFSPAAEIKRGDFILMLVRAYGLNADTQDNFFDVSPNKYYYDAVATAKALGIAKGDGNCFNPESSITRAEAMALLYRTMDLVGVSLPVGNLNGFSDSSDIKPWFKNEISALVHAGIINGYGGKISPNAFMTRAELSTALYKALSYSASAV